jgi:hypothetical protein
VHDEFTDESGAAVPSGTYDTPIDADPARVLRVLVDSSAPGSAGGLLWGVGGEWIRDDFRIARDVPARSDAELRSSLLGAIAMLRSGRRASRGSGPMRPRTRSPATAPGGYTSEGLRLSAGTCAWRHTVLQVHAGLSATQAGADVEYETGDSSRLRLTSAGWTLGATVGCRF